MTQEKRLKDGKIVDKEGDIRVFQTHYGWWHDTGGYASLHPRLRATRSARAFDLSGRAAVIGGVGIQPEMLNAEGEARELLAEGGALAQPSECRATKKKRLKDAKAAAKEGDIRVFQTHDGG